MSFITSKSVQSRRDYIELLRFCGSAHDNTGYATHGNLGNTAQVLNRVKDAPPSARSLFPILYSKAKATGLFSQIDSETQKLIKNTAMVLIAREAASQRWLKQAIESFEDSNIPIILLKGAAFSGYLYSEEAPRPGVDVDLLVKQSDFDRACSVLQQTMDPLILAEDRLVTHENLFERVFAPSSPSNPTVELHRGLTNPYIFNIDEEALWQASEPHCKYTKENVRVLSPNHTLLHLAVHGFRDLEFCSHGLLDVDQMFLLRGIDEDKLYQDAETWGARAVLYHLLSNCQQIMGTNIPSNLLARLTPSPLSKRTQLLALEKTQTDPEKKSPGRIAQLWSQLIFPDRLSAALRFQADYILTRLKDLIYR